MPVINNVSRRKTKPLIESVPARIFRPGLYRPHLLFWSLSLLLTIVLLHVLAAMHPGDPTAIPLDCLDFIRTTDYAQVVHLDANSQQLEAVQFVSQLTGGQPAVLVQVANIRNLPSLDVYVYGCTSRPHLMLRPLFKQIGLIGGEVAISAANTLVASSLDQVIPQQMRSMMQPMKQNVYREYSWRGGSFTQVAFPGIYPVTDRGEAEVLQRQADQGQSLPWSDPLATVQQMAQDIFGWNSGDTQEMLQSNDDISARVLLIHQNPHLEVNVSLMRLIQSNETGLWFVTAARTSGITLDRQHLSSLMPSPLLFQGKGALVSGQTTARLFDHTLLPLSTASPTTLNIDADGTYTGVFPYNGIASDQQGLLLIQSLPAQGTKAAGQLLLTSVLLG